DTRASSGLAGRCPPPPRFPSRPPHSQRFHTWSLPFLRGWRGAGRQTADVESDDGAEQGISGRASFRPAGTLGGLCQRVTALVCSTHHDCANRGAIRRMLRSAPTSSSARRRTWRSLRLLPGYPFLVFPSRLAASSLSRPSSGLDDVR